MVTRFKVFGKEKSQSKWDGPYVLFMMSLPWGLSLTIMDIHGTYVCGEWTLLEGTSRRPLRPPPARAIRVTNPSRRRRPPPSPSPVLTVARGATESPRDLYDGGGGAFSPSKLPPRTRSGPGGFGAWWAGGGRASAARL